MSIRKIVTITATCDGPCGTVLKTDAFHVPDGWTLIRVDSFEHSPGESPTKFTSGLCPKCTVRFFQILKHEGYSFVGKEKG